MRQLLFCFSLVLLLLGCTEPAGQSKASTASAQVTVLSESFLMPGLNRSRQVRLYLPPGYENSAKRYPVLYMHDGQNLFDEATAYAGEWGADEILDELAATGQLELILVGIDNGAEKRMTELNPVDHAEFGKAEGKAYLEFIANTVKPYIDRHYRTLPDVQHTAIMGSSMGGLISHYAILQFPQVFGKAGIFSPSYWALGEQIHWFEQQPVAADARLYFYMGAKEGGPMVPDMARLYQAVLSTGHAPERTRYHLVAQAEHNEAAWRNEFKTAVLWLFNDNT
ncbi:alpha/beta hydrolase [Rheinheimera mesophila]|uniref:Alpha/beta hydrolase n=1 Tax=Rheinheimera mesophila TaxID=1547515 RepID=A0A3P3QG77_9GAMM|nr:alpha/beta hydrolase-fold protein [Rheinheimera mesophila]KKL03084.1 esterase [Rheinheimera mesophila]RRJ19499.1 alpha/beta hydrolase [Rheinheimera mesophila]